MNVKKLIAGLAAVRDLMNSSSGVCGLHLNGDYATWGELERGGRFKEWLRDFNEAEDEIRDVLQGV